MHTNRRAGTSEILSGQHTTKASHRSIAKSILFSLIHLSIPVLPSCLSWPHTLYPLLPFRDFRDRLFIYFFPYVLFSWILTLLVWIKLVFSDLKNIFNSVNIPLKTLLSTDRTTTPNASTSQWVDLHHKRNQTKGTVDKWQTNFLGFNFFSFFWATTLFRAGLNNHNKKTCDVFDVQTLSCAPVNALLKLKVKALCIKALNVGGVCFLSVWNSSNPLLFIIWWSEALS